MYGNLSAKQKREERCRSSRLCRKIASRYTRLVRSQSLRPFLFAVARHDSFLLRVLCGRLLNHRPDHGRITFDPARDRRPLPAVPPLEPDRAATLVIGAAELERLR